MIIIEGGNPVCRSLKKEKQLCALFMTLRKKKTGRQIICWLNRLDTRASVN